MAADRSVSDVLQDILRNVQDILRSEVRLAKAEIRQEATHAATAALWMTIGVVGLLSAWMFLLWTAVYALAAVLPIWAATLVIAVAMAGCRGCGDHNRATEVHANQANAGADDGVAPGESRMDEAAHKIEAHIDRTRDRLGSNLRELENRIDAATDWREQFRARPHLFIGGAIAGGALLAAVLRPTASQHVFDSSTEGTDRSRPSRATVSTAGSRRSNYGTTSKVP